MVRKRQYTAWSLGIGGTLFAVSVVSVATSFGGTLEGPGTSGSATGEEVHAASDWPAMPYAAHRDADRDDALDPAAAEGGGRPEPTVTATTPVTTTTTPAPLPPPTPTQEPAPTPPAASPPPSAAPQPTTTAPKQATNPPQLVAQPRQGNPTPPPKPRTTTTTAVPVRTMTPKPVTTTTIIVAPEQQDSWQPTAPRTTMRPDRDGFGRYFHLPFFIW